MTKLYLDIDGTLVGRGGVPAQGLTEFLRFATENFDCYWLSRIETRLDYIIIPRPWNYDII